jgi:YHS domain-containing protein
MDDNVKDPVCGMQVSRDSFAMEHLGIHYAFCSQRCQDRFTANPHLYIGLPGQKAPVQRGMESIKRRRFVLEQPLTAAEAASLAEALGSLMGIRHTDVAGNAVTITYDLLQTTADQIAARMGEIGLNMGAGWAERLQRGFINYLEECELDSLEVAPRRGHH